MANETTPKVITETKCTCEVCQTVWFYGKKDEQEKRGYDMLRVGKALMCCGGCFPALFIPDKRIADLNKCPKCGSRAVKKETVEHHV